MCIRDRDTLSPFERKALAILVPISVVFAVLGTTASVLDIVGNFSSSGTPFAC